MILPTQLNGGTVTEAFVSLFGVLKEIDTIEGSQTPSQALQADIAAFTPAAGENATQGNLSGNIQNTVTFKGKLQEN